MKKILFYPLIIAAITFTGCNDWLEIEEQDVLLPEEALNTADDYEKLINSAYDVLRGNGGSFLGGRSQLFSELLAHEVSNKGLTGNKLEVYRRNPGFFNGEIGGYYQEPYIAIFRANVLLEEIESVEGLSQAEIDRLRGEAFFLRALCHFDVLNLFAQPFGFTDDNQHPGISLRTEASQDAKLRSTFEEAYIQIESDFLEAASLLADGNDRGFGFATENAAKAYLAKLYFLSNQYQEAFTLSNEVISSGEYNLDQDLTHRFSQGLSSEGIFVMPSLNFSDHRGAGFTNNFRSDEIEPIIKISEEVYELVAEREGDARLNWFTVANEDTSDEEIYITKYNGLSFFDVPLIHLTELKLIRAESAALTDQELSTAIGDINDIRERAFGSADQNLSPNANTTSIINAARLERRIELVTEGNYLHDVKRVGILENSSNLRLDGAIWSCPGLLLEFPTLETVEGFVGNNPNGC
ncbi:RagB/SusD family nutrient uptake outer membrane protein [Marivirga sp. S37H4]|uniref:RagB/SusD family nutrient uptake outer membrane protein n=1 Tax=Marivirga aurantiaca TaxID=2802615 RepID=A0A935CBU5_9BACT|nr:RagB/SusD family nutrient uptake outer membrane protein [Marivirga aurantiaca]MBK6267279.1 RagB/SusD family nutrient uptake outer membrane protein [Marivirga aurantiaca]